MTSVASERFSQQQRYVTSIWRRVTQARTTMTAVLDGPESSLGVSDKDIITVSHRPVLFAFGIMQPGLVQAIGGEPSCLIKVGHTGLVAVVPNENNEDCDVVAFWADRQPNLLGTLSSSGLQVVGQDDLRIASDVYADRFIDSRHFEVAASVGDVTITSVEGGGLTWVAYEKPDDTPTGPLYTLDDERRHPDPTRIFQLGATAVRPRQLAGV